LEQELFQYKSALGLINIKISKAAIKISSVYNKISKANCDCRTLLSIIKDVKTTLQEITDKNSQMLYQKHEPILKKQDIDSTENTLSEREDRPWEEESTNIKSLPLPSKITTLSHHFNDILHTCGPYNYRTHNNYTMLSERMYAIHAASLTGHMTPTRDPPANTKYKR
jgi:hypothetical protein